MSELAYAIICGAAVFLLGIIVGFRMARTLVVTLKSLLDQAERKVEAQQSLLINTMREKVGLEPVETPMHPPAPEPDDGGVPGCGGGEEERARAWDRQRAEIESKTNESFAETLADYGLAENLR